MRRRSLFVSFPVLPQVKGLILARYDAVFNEAGRVLSAQDLVRAARGHDTMVVTATDRLERATIESLPHTVRVIATYSVGHEHIDLAAASNRKLIVINTPDVLTDAVAEVALFLMIGAARRGTESIALLRSRDWPGWSPVQLPGRELSKRRLGIFGMGRIGQAVAQRARAFGMVIHYTKRTQLAEEAQADFIFHAESKDLLAASDILLLASPSTPSTQRFLTRGRIDNLPEDAIVVNISRGDLVDDDALVEALSSGRLFAAGLDVFAGEPKIDSRYFNLPNVFMTPHIGSSTVEARVRMAATLVSALEQLDQGIQPRNQVV